MKKTKFGSMLSVLAVSALLMVSCSKKLDPLTSSLFNAEPSPLELVGTKVPVTVNGRFPAKWFDKNITVKVTPVLKYAGGEALGSTKTFQGEKVAGNGTTVSQETGSTFVLKSQFDYKNAMKSSELYLRFSVERKGKSIELPDVKVADGVLATAALASAYNATPAMAPDAFQRIIKEAHDANIMFLVNRAELRKSELNSNNLDAWKDIVKEANDNDRKNLNVEIAAYASPEGGFKYNDRLAGQREKNTTTYLSKEFKNADVDTEVNAHYTAQDWDGFKKLVEASRLQDKKLVLSVLSMYNDPATREREIRNISTIYSELAETILPELRRSRLIANVEIIGKTDQELVAAAAQGASDLSLEEMLYAATLKDVNAKALYEKATKKYPNDYRAWNNLGACHFIAKDYNKAEDAFKKAKQVGASKAVEANNNLALLALANNKVDEAEALLGAASGANTINEAMGVLYIKKGEYNKAAQSFGDAKTNNAVIAQILTKDYSKAQRTLDAVATKDATSAYLAAVIAARTNNASGVVSNLKVAKSQGVSSSDIATDKEFARFATNSDFQSLVR